jgi:hypothetical protein
VNDHNAAKNSTNRSAARSAWTIGVALFLALSSCTDETSDPMALSGSLGRADPLDIGLMTASVSSLQRSGIFIQLPAGLPDELASHLLARFQEASIAKQLPLARTGTIPELTIKGHARAGAARSGTAIALVWEVLDAEGKRVMLLSGDALVRRRNSSNMDRYDPWAVVDEATLENIADAAASELASWYAAEWVGAPINEPDLGLATASIGEDGPEREPIDFTTPSILQQTPSQTVQTPLDGMAARDATLSAGTASPQPVALPPAAPVTPLTPPEATTASKIPTSQPVPDIPAEGLTTAYVAPPVTSMGASTSNRLLFDVSVGLAPGDGQLSLAAAVQEALIERETSTATAGSAYRVIGDVTLQQSAAGQAQVQIEWSVFTKSGTALGLITQSNQLEATSVSGPWGDIAVAAGSAAAAGILELIHAPTPPV